MNAGRDVFSQSYDVINHLFIVGVNFLLILPLCDETVFALMFICADMCEVP